MSMTLYHYWRSSCSWRVRWALNLKGLKAQMVHIDLLSGECEREPHLSRHPMGFVPVLNVGGRNLIESVAILEWLEEMHPTPQLYPGDSYARAHIRSLVEIINAGTQPLQNLNALDEYSSDPNRRKQWSQKFIRAGLQAFQKTTQKSCGRFSVGDTVTAADLYLIPQLYNAQRNEVAFSEFPVLEQIWKNAISTPECQAAHPDRFKP
jgi:maleylacetoacetate isomerase